MSVLPENTEVILVNEEDAPLGLMSKLEAHKQGLLHRAFSVFILNSKKQMLLQKRAASKYHSGGLWSNTCCSHPGAGESMPEVCERRLNEEMGFTTPLNYLTAFIYRTEFDSGLIEHEYDHVYVGIYDAVPRPDFTEVSEWKYVDLDWLEADLMKNPLSYTVWFRIIFPQVKDYVMGK